MIWIDKEWLFKAMSLNNDIDFNKFAKAELVQILNHLRMVVDWEEIYEKIQRN